MKCPSPFFVWFHHRSGSTHLCSLLDSHPDIASWGEIFYRGEGGAEADLFTRSEKTSEAEFLEHLYSFRWDEAGTNLCEADPEPPLVRAVGFKLKYQQATVYPAVMQYLRPERSMKAIHLVRTNLLSALVSAAMIPRLLTQFRRPNLLTGESPQEIERTVILDPNTIFDDLCSLELRIENARTQLEGFESLEITYEDLIADQQTTCRRVLEFLDVDATQELVSRYVKIMPRSLREGLSNLDEVAAAIRGTRFETCLEVE
ncbi:MAG: sulfotransferase [Rubripirellula sp.]